MTGAYTDGCQRLVLLHPDGQYSYIFVLLLKKTSTDHAQLLKTFIVLTVSGHSNIKT